MRTTKPRNEAAVNRSLRMTAIVTGDLPPGSWLFPMGCIELLGIKRARVELHIALDVRIFLAEHFLVVDANFDPRRHPATCQWAIVLKADILKLVRIGTCGLKQTDKQKPVLLDPELFRLQIA